METPILYTQTDCPDSTKVRAWLTEQRIPFVERAVTDDAEAARELQATGVFATPLVVVGDAKLLGFKPQALATLLCRRTTS